MTNLLIDALSNNPNAKVMISGPDRKLISAYIEADFSFDQTSEFSDVDPGSLAENVSALAQTYGNASGQGQRVVKAIQQTLSMWNGSTKPTFVIPITLITQSKSQDILETVSYLHQSTAPDYWMGMMYAPHGYGSSVLDRDAWSRGDYGDLLNIGEAAFRNSLKGTWTIQYANWFRASRLVLLSVSSVVSKENIKGTNKPLYAKMNLQFQPAILPTKNEVAGWFMTRTSS